MTRDAQVYRPRSPPNIPIGGRRKRRATFIKHVIRYILASKDLETAVSEGEVDASLEEYDYCLLLVEVHSLMVEHAVLKKVTM